MEEEKKGVCKACSMADVALNEEGKCEHCAGKSE